MLKRSSSICKTEIDLRGPQGNAFFLLGYAVKLAQQLRLDGKAIEAEMKVGGYRHLVLTFDEHFGDVVDLIVPEGWEDEA